MTRSRSPTGPLKGRGSHTAPDPRYDAFRREAEDDGWSQDDGQPPPPHTELFRDLAKSIITRNDSPDVHFSQSINPYRGCEHGCIYCYARPSHAYLGLSPGLDFETRIGYKEDAAARLRQALSRPGYVCEPIALGTNTDAYQPIERKLAITRSLLEVLAEFAHPFTLVTKSALVERDLDLLGPMARENLVRVTFSVTTLDRELSRVMEPRAAAPERRLQAMRRLAEAGIPVSVNFAPLIPGLNDNEMERVLEASREAGAATAQYLLLRLPHELKKLFEQWLRDHYPARAQHVLSLIRQMRAGRLNDPRFGQRFTGTGAFAELMEQRFRVACTRLGLTSRPAPLDCSRLRRPPSATGQLDLF